MKVSVKPGRYVLAVSGGVDSMVLMDVLAKIKHIELIIAHFNHGIRQEAAKDEAFVRQAASKRGLKFEAGRGRLGRTASEAQAREARYRFLFKVQEKHRAQAVITAHHQDDLIETVIINLIRGSGRRGVTAISDNSRVLRPFLGYPKSDITAYALKAGIVWKEDKTNAGDEYLRNRIRNKVTSKLSGKEKQDMLLNIDKVAKNDMAISRRIAKLSQYIFKDNLVNRSEFSLLPVSIADELVVFWLKQNNVMDFDKKIVSRVNIALRTYKENSICPVIGDFKLNIAKKTARFSHSV